MVEENTDHNIIDTSLREMEEEIGMHQTGSRICQFFTELKQVFDHVVYTTKGFLEEEESFHIALLVSSQPDHSTWLNRCTGGHR
jgi:hypothetical protein